MLFAFRRRPLRCILFIFRVPYVPIPPLLPHVSIYVAVKLAVNESVRARALTLLTLISRALGVALPLEGSHARVFYDRVLRASPDDAYQDALLAHVMAHEIAHVLQGLIRHSVAEF
jgi:hypothetical protein